MPDKKEMDESRKFKIGLFLYTIIMLALIIVYHDFMITVTAIVVLAVFLFLHYAPRIVEQRQKKKK